MTHDPREALDSLLAFRHGDTKHLTAEHARILYEALTASPGEQQPVAWRWRAKGSNGSHTFSATEPVPHPDYLTEPLYTSPPPAANIELLKRIEYASRKDSLTDYERIQSVRTIVCGAITNINSEALRREAPALSGVAEDPLWQKLRDLFGLDGWYDGIWQGVPNPQQIVTHVEYVANERARLLKESMSRPDAGGGVLVKPPLGKFAQWIERERDGKTITLWMRTAAGTPFRHSVLIDSGYGDVFVELESALSKPSDAVNESAEARLRTILDVLNGVAPAAENLACNREQAGMDGCMVKVSRQALDEVLAAVNEVAIQAATSGWSVGDKATTYRVDYDGFVGTKIGTYRTREGREGVVLQQDGTKIVHVYGPNRVEEVGDEAVSNVMRSALKAKATVSSWSASKQEYANRAISGDEAQKSEGRTNEAKARADAVASGSASHENHGSQIQAGVGSERSSPSEPTVGGYGSVKAAIDAADANARTCKGFATALERIRDGESNAPQIALDALRMPWEMSGLPSDPTASTEEDDGYARL